MMQSDTAAATIRIATRASTLALAQTTSVADALRDHHPDLTVRVVTVQTVGDQNQRASVSALGDGAFVRGVEQALVNGVADIAVHSAKDLPTVEVPGLTLAAFPRRADPRDVLVSRSGSRFAELQPGARLGTGSPRRAAIARSLRPDLDVTGIRGNVDTRLAKLDAGEYDAIVLAAAGLARLELLARVSDELDPSIWTPAAGQGALAVQCRAGDHAERFVAALDDPDTRAAVSAERAALRRLGSGCRTPCGVFGQVDGEMLTLCAVLVATDGTRAVRVERSGSAAAPEALGIDVADRLAEEGADLLVYAEGGGS